MTTNQWLGSALIVFHLVAVFVGAIPSPQDYALDTTLRPPGVGLRAWITTSLDEMLPAVVRGHRLSWALSQPIRRMARPYLSLTGQYEKWNMFSNPAVTQPFAELRYHFASRDGAVRIERHLVYPASPPGSWRLLGAYFDSFTDKAFANCFERYQTLALQAEQAGRPMPVEEMQEVLLPLMRHYARQRSETARPAGESLTRVEFWRGDAPAAPPGGTLPPQTVARRRDVLERLYSGRVAHDSDTTRIANATEREADITWRRWAAEDYR